MIIVTGANGKLGRAVVEQLLKRAPAEQIAVSVRDLNKAQDLKDRGVRVRQGDFDDADSLLHAFEGASQVLIVSSGIMGEGGIRQHQTAIETAKKAGAGRVLYTSHIGSSPNSYFPPMLNHAATEELLKASGMAYTSLRNGFYATLAGMLIGRAIQTGELITPEDGPVAWTSHPDLAEAAAAILMEQKFDGLTPNLTACEAMDMDGLATIASEITGRPLRRIVVSDEEYQDHLKSQGQPEDRANMLMGMFLASRNGEFAQASTTLSNLIGRPPMNIRELLKESISHQHG
ncbi:SDR family oxidoreductase [Paenibacillus sp. FSL R7-0297]|uniref:SDR family oxidoreductase n=1 Tax=unclassified Paenibacillus TaxID=185978 RepID=UPI0004F5A78D|nr:SDR family oxidoreductase [Paenibacillus sp. FSL R5-0912]AIQ39152.1 NmrA family transcriptional regulator [Paenibacillus sp. FSL R5-0912]